MTDGYPPWAKFATTAIQPGGSRAWFPGDLPNTAIGTAVNMRVETFDRLVFLGARAIVALSTLLALAVGVSPAMAGELIQEAIPVPRLAIPDFAALARHLGPSVVNISVTHEIDHTDTPRPGAGPTDPVAPFLARRVIGNREEMSLGSGFIVSPDGYILTNRHVVKNATVIDVKLTDKREFKGRVIGSDSLTDVALIKIDAEDLPAVATGDASRLQVGDWVMAIGSPYGFGNTVTQGIVSAKSRSFPEEAFVPFIQTDVPINPGSSGGPLFDLSGRVIAINSLIYSKTGGYQGLSFSIPIDIALDVKDQLLKKGYVERGQLGVTVQEMSQALARSFGLSKPDGALISALELNGPASRAGLHVGDVVLMVNGVELHDAVDLLTTVAKVQPGSEIDAVVWRAGATVHLKAIVGALESGDQPSGVVTQPARLGMTLRPLTLQEQQKLGLDHGLVVQQVAGRRAGVGLLLGDIVLAVNESPVATTADFIAQIERSRGIVALLIQRGKERLYLPVDLSE